MVVQLPTPGGSSGTWGTMINAAFDEMLSPARDALEFPVRDRGGQVYDVKAFGAVGNGVADDRAAIQAVLGPRRIVHFPEGTYRLASAHPQAAWALDAAYDDLELRFAPGAVLLLDVDNVRGILIDGPTKAAREATGSIATRDSYPLIQQAGGSVPVVYAMTAAVAKGALSVTLATVGDAANFAPDDYVLIRTGQLLALATNGQPLGEINQVVTASAITGVLTLRWPTAHRYAQEWFLAGRTGITSATLPAGTAITSSSVANPTVITATAHGLVSGDRITISGHTGSTPALNGSHVVTVLTTSTFTIPVNVTVGGTGGTFAVEALFGVSKITDRVIRRPRITGGTFRHGPAANSTTTNQRFIDGQGAIDPHWTNLTADCRITGLDSFGRHRGLRMQGVTIRTREVPAPTGTSFATVIGDTCCTDVDVDGLTILAADNILYVHVHEGAALVRMSGLNLQGPANAAGTNAWISMAARAEDVQIVKSLIRGGAAAATGMRVDATCVGGLVDDCLIDTIDPLATAASILGPNWVWGSGNYLPQGSMHSTTALEDSVRVLSSRIDDPAATAPLGTLPRYTRVKSIWLNVVQAFNSSGTDELTVGYDADPDALGTVVDVSTAGVKTVTLGVGASYNIVRRDVKIYYTAGGTAPTAGRAIVNLEYEHVAVG